ncbi:MAG: hypothetical protein JXD18_15105 [Anaerolineae bacterium]|nr:hypothetical protein [Anaerolineae bacterium]
MTSPEPRRAPFKQLTGLLLFLLAGGEAAAGILHVPDPYTTIGFALSVAPPGDTVLVACGTYQESNMIMRTGVCLLSETGEPDCVVIDGQLAGHPILHCINVDAQTRIEGITFTNGGGYNYTPYEGGAIYARNADLTIENCRFYQNKGGTKGGGIYFEDSEPTLIDCVFEGNFAEFGAEPWGDGGALYVTGSSLSITGCRFEENRALGVAGVVYAYDSAIGIANSVFESNTVVNSNGGALWISCSTLSLANTSFDRNESIGAGGGAIYAHSSELNAITCTFSMNEGVVNTSSAVDLHAGQGSFSNSTFYAAFSMYNPGYLVGTSSTTHTEFESCLFVIGENEVALQCIGGATHSFTCCNIYRESGGAWEDCYAGDLGVNGNISADPQFCGVYGSGNLYLQSDSPCAPENNDCGVQIGAWPVNCGETSARHRTWSAVKALY